MVLVMEVWVRLRALNRCITAVVARCGDPRLSQLLLDRPRSDSRQTELRRIRLAHLALHRAAELLQRHVGTTMAMTVANTFCGATYSAYGVLELWTLPERALVSAVNTSIPMAILWTFLNAVRLSSVALPSSAAASQAQNRRMLVMRAAAVGVPWPMRSELAVLQSQVADTTRFSFTGAGFIRVDRSLLVTVLGTIITYLVILGQISL
ncbi:uncharacterized protein LOC124594499 [Schistocerca americana]|uniref:uncharacterized protein LOC124594499 n=1 Tax=Schistocerca americana TaxID=7009 RepID=UPI001F4FA8F0|nr:uncharacterized protein LOC124594499 [Schistocerca americana]